jgi:hypothetical protein
MLAERMALDLSNPKQRGLLSILLADIAEYGIRGSRPMLTAVVLSKKSGLPNKGFFELARTLGVQGSETDKNFHTRTLESICEQWADWPS